MSIIWEGMQAQPTFSLPSPAFCEVLYYQPFPLSLQAQCSRGQLHWPFVNLDAKIPPDVNVLIFS